MAVIKELWYLPRPRKINKFRGGFPLHFEKRLFETYKPKLILQPFGGMAEHGIKMDILHNSEIVPDVIADAHNLPFVDGCFDFVLLDPPYSDEESSRIFKTSKINLKQCVKEAVRVASLGGYIALYHIKMPARPRYTRYDRIICILTRVNHSARICVIFQKINTLFDIEDKKAWS